VIFIPRSKFNINTSKSAKKKRTLNGHTFDSDVEYKFYESLLVQQDQGLIKNIIIQPKFLLQEEFTKYNKKIRKIEYIADFHVFYTDNTDVIFDVKGMVMPDFKLKRKLFDYKYQDKTLRCVNYSKMDGGWCDIEVIEKGRKERKKEKNNK
jgi:hypothetical protein